MKNLKFLFGAFCAVGMMASCSSSDDVVGGETTPDGIANGQNLYLSVSVMSANEGTRATEVGDPVDDDGNKADYEKGTGKENDVTNAYFYFYNADGSATLMSIIIIRPPLQKKKTVCQTWRCCWMLRSLSTQKRVI